MDYPLNMTKPAKSPAVHESTTGFAVANDASEHESLSDAGYVPKFEAAEPSVDDMTKAEIMAALDAKGVKFDKAKTKAELADLLKG